MLAKSFLFKKPYKRSICRPFTSNTKKFYQFKRTPKLDEYITNINTTHKAIEQLKQKVNQNTLLSIYDHHYSNVIADSNAIEGSSLTRGETFTLLQLGISVGGKPIKDLLDAIHHQEALELLFEFIRNDQPLTEWFVKELNALLMKGVSHTPARDVLGRLVYKKLTGGAYKTIANNVLTKNGSMHEYVDPLQVPPQMEELIEAFPNLLAAHHPVEAGSILHYNLVRIHPFDDGNGRVARLLLNLTLMKNHYIPVIIPAERSKREEYYDNLEIADSGNLVPFIEFVAGCLVETQESILHQLERLSGIKRGCE